MSCAGHISEGMARAAEKKKRETFIAVYVWAAKNRPSWFEDPRIAGADIEIIRESLAKIEKRIKKP